MNPKKTLGALTMILGTIAGATLLARRLLPKTRGVMALSGLHGPVEVVRDRWGVPHLYAQNEHDLFFAQGYVHAQDRLWQMELQRRSGAGRLSEILGEATLEVDRFFRTVGLFRAAQAELPLLSDESKAALEAYAAGVNAYVTAHKGRLGLEFLLLRHQPEPWQPVDTLCWAKTVGLNLSSNWASEVLRMRLTCKLGADLAADLEPSYPADNPPVVPGPGLAEGREPPPNGWGGPAVTEALRLLEQIIGRDLQATPAPAGPLPHIPLRAAASNQWVVSGRRSASGKPLLANDTHMAPAMPGVWYQIHLSGGRYNAAGVSFPGAPGVIVGHNERCAWGITIGWQDAQDLFIEKPNPANPHQYEFQGQWQDAQVVREVIHVKGHPQPVVEAVIITRHGPLVNQLFGDSTPLALRWTALEPGDQLDAILAINRAGDWQEFRSALARWVAPSCNFNYADVSGDIGLLQAGRVPVRAKGHGIAPVPGWTGEYEWLGYLSLDELPQTLNPESGWLAAANNLIVDAAYPHFLSTDLENPCRATRIAALLQAQETFDAGDFARFQLDTYSAQAERFLRHFRSLQPNNQREADALDLLRGWDFRMARESVAATLYQVCRLRALHLVFDRPLGELAETYIGVGASFLSDVSPYHGRSFIRLLDMLDDNSDNTWLRDPETGIPLFRAELMHTALRQALHLLREELGPDMSQWTWGRFAKVIFPHAMGAVKPLDRLFNRGPYPTGGDHDTLLRASQKPAFPFEPVTVADALRFIADTSDWDRSYIIAPPGQSGHVTSPHYGDRAEAWQAGQLQPMPFSRVEVERVAEARLILTPA